MKCSPGDYGYLAENQQALLDARSRYIYSWIETLEYGDFQIESDHGIIDGNVASRIAEIEKAMMGGPAMFEVSKFGIDLDEIVSSA